MRRFGYMSWTITVRGSSPEQDFVGAPVGYGDVVVAGATRSVDVSSQPYGYSLVPDSPPVGDGWP